VAATLGRDLNESVAGHVLHAVVRLVHELKQFVDDGLEEAPVSAQEARVLTDDVHDVGRYDRLVVLATLLLTESQQLLDHSHQKPATFKILTLYIILCYVDSNSH